MSQKVILQRLKSSDYIILYQMKGKVRHLTMSENYSRNNNVIMLFQ